METTLIAQGPVDVNVSRCTVRVKTTVWADKRGLHTKKSLMFLRRQCAGFNVLAELAEGDTDAAMETLRQIVGDSNDECQHEVAETGRCLHCGATEQEISESP